jgi:hypothetical protein
MKVDSPQDTRLVLLGSHEKLPILSDCDFVRNLRNVKLRDGNLRHLLICKTDFFQFESKIRWIY